MIQMAAEMKQELALSMWAQGYSRNRIHHELHCSYATIDKWIMAAGLVDDQEELRRNGGRVPVGPARQLTRVTRDPCPKCGVRGDLGCKHRPAQAEEAL